MRDNNQDFDLLCDAWKKQEVESMEIAIDNIKTKASVFERKIKRRNWLELGVGALVVAFFVVTAVTGEGLFLRLGSTLITMGAVFVCTFLYLKGGTKTLPNPTVDSIRYMGEYKKQLLKQARLLRSVPLWYLFPFVPGVIVFKLDKLLDAIANGELIWGFTRIYLPIIVFFSLVAWLNIYAARKLEKEAAQITQTDFKENH